MTADLARLAHPALSVDAAVAAYHTAFATPEAWALLMGPSSQRLVALPAGQPPTNEHGAAEPIDDVFEARLFGEQGEVHWLRDGDSGRASLVADDGTVSVEGFQPATSPWAFSGERRFRRYLLWGEREAAGEPSTGWVALSSARIGPYVVPLAGGLGPSRRVALVAVEYLAADAEGNVFVGHERLVRLEPSQPDREDDEEVDGAGQASV